MFQTLVWSGYIAYALEKLGPTPHFIEEKVKFKEVSSIRVKLGLARPVLVMLGLNDEESLSGDASQLSCFFLFLQVWWELTQVRGANLLLLVVVVWWWWQQEPGLRTRGSQKPQVRLGPLKQMDSAQRGLPLWVGPLLPWDGILEWQ